MLFGGGCTTCNEYEAMVRRTCRTMSTEEYRSLMSTCPGVDAGKLDALVSEFEFESDLLTIECRSCFADIKAGASFLSGGRKGKPRGKSGGKSRGKSSPKAKVSPSVRAEFENARNTYVKRKPRPRSTKGEAPAPNWKAECPKDYSSKRKCVVDPVTSECIPDREIAGDSKTGSRFSDGHCYSTFHLQSHARSQHAAGKKNLNLPSGKAYSRSDLMKIDKTRLESYAHETMLFSISGGVVEGINNSTDQQRKTFEEFVYGLKRKGNEKQSGSAMRRLWNSYLVKGLRKVSMLGAKLVYNVGSWLSSKAMTLGYFIASNPRMARFFLLMVKSMVEMFCQRMAISMGKVKYKYKNRGAQMVDSVVTSEVLQMAAEGMVAGVFTGDTWMNVGNAMFKGVTAVVKDIPFVGSAVKGVGEVASALSGPAKEAAKFSAELLLYQQDIHKAFGSVMDILGMIVNPNNCMNKESEIVTSDESLDGETVSEGGFFDYHGSADKSIEGGSSEPATAKREVLQIEQRYGRRFNAVRRAYNAKYLKYLRAKPRQESKKKKTLEPSR